MLAEDIHVHGNRADQRFLAVNCAAIAPSLFESTFFGHKRGAFSGATADKPGLVELVDGGTLFLDEVGELPLETQAKLLRFLAKGTFWPVGGTSERSADVRIISATHRDILNGSFREDLFYRLSVITIRIPPLESVDVEAIAQSIAVEVSVKYGIDLTDEDIVAIGARCSTHEWKGGVRELSNAIERLMILWGLDRDREGIFVEVLGPRSPLPSAKTPVPSAYVSKDLESLIFLATAEQCTDVKDLARRTGRTVQAIYGRLKKLELEPRDLGSTPKLNARLVDLRRRVALALPWIEELVTE